MTLSSVQGLKWGHLEASFIIVVVELHMSQAILPIYTAFQHTRSKHVLKNLIHFLSAHQSEGGKRSYSLGES